MSDAVYQAFAVQMATDPAYAAAVKANPAGLDAYDLTPEERQRLLALTVEQAPAPVGAAPAPTRELGQRRSKSGILALGGAAAALGIGAAGYAGYQYLHQGRTPAEVAGHPTLGYGVVQEHGDLSAGQPFRLEAQCPSDRAPLSGGFVADDDADADTLSGLHVTDSHPTEHGWVVAATAAKPLGLTVQVACAAVNASADKSAAFDGVIGYEAVADDQASADPSTEQQGRAHCHSAEPVSRLPLAAGFAGLSGELASSLPESTSWAFRLKAGGQAGAAQLHVVCAIGSLDPDVAFGAGGVALVTAGISDNPVDPGQVMPVTIDCPEGTHAAGGGYDLGAGNLLVVSNGPAANGWQVKVVNRPGGEAGSFKVLANCIV